MFWVWCSHEDGIITVHTMTDKQKFVLQSLIDGKRYAEIAQEMGVTRQTVYNIARQAIGHGGNYTNGYYPNIRNFIAENCRNMVEFAFSAGVDYKLVQEMLKQGRSPRWPDISKMMAYTGMDVRTLMVREPNNVQAQA